MSPTAASRLTALRGADLRALHTNGTPPDPAELTGVIDGAVLTGQLGLPIVRKLGLWRGKVFDRDESGAVVGLNRLGVGPMEIRRYHFTARVAGSLSATGT